MSYNTVTYLDIGSTLRQISLDSWMFQLKYHKWSMKLNASKKMKSAPYVILRAVSDCMLELGVKSCEERLNEYDSSTENGPKFLKDLDYDLYGYHNDNEIPRSFEDIITLMKDDLRNGLNLQF